MNGCYHLWLIDLRAACSSSKVTASARHNHRRVSTMLRCNHFPDYQSQHKRTTILTGSSGGGDSSATFITRNVFRAPSQATVDFRLSRQFRFTESVNLEFLAEAFNLFNRVNVTSVNDTLYSLDSRDPNNLQLITEADFGLPGSTGLNNSFFFRERQIQLAVRFYF